MEGSDRRATPPQAPAPRERLREESDEALVAATRAGREGAFAALFARHWGPLLGFCRKMLGSTEDAEDVLQEVFTAAHAAILADEREIQVRPWLHRIARNRCLNHLRRPIAEGRDSMDGHPGGDVASTTERVHHREELRAIFDDLRELPETQRNALLLRQLGQLSYAEVAALTGTTVPAVRSRLVRARLTLAARRTARGVVGALAPIGGALEWLRSRLVNAPRGGDPAATVASLQPALEAKLRAILASVALVAAGGLAAYESEPGETGASVREPGAATTERITTPVEAGALPGRATEPAAAPPRAVASRTGRRFATPPPAAVEEPARRVSDAATREPAEPRIADGGSEREAEHRVRSAAEPGRRGAQPGAEGPPAGDRPPRPRAAPAENDAGAEVDAILRHSRPDRLDSPAE